MIRLPFRMPSFQGRIVSFREGIYIYIYILCCMAQGRWYTTPAPSIYLSVNSNQNDHEVIQHWLLIARTSHAAYGVWICLVFWLQVQLLFISQIKTLHLSFTVFVLKFPSSVSRSMPLNSAATPVTRSWSRSWIYPPTISGSWSQRVGSSALKKCISRQWGRWTQICIVRNHIYIYTYIYIYMCGFPYVNYLIFTVYSTCS